MYMIWSNGALKPLCIPLSSYLSIVYCFQLRFQIRTFVHDYSRERKIRPIKQYFTKATNYVNWQSPDADDAFSLLNILSLISQLGGYFILPCEQQKHLEKTMKRASSSGGTLMRDETGDLITFNQGNWKSTEMKGEPLLVSRIIGYDFRIRQPLKCLI